jgi:hypothetical protein
MKNSNNAVGNRFRVLPVCSAVPQPLRHRVPQKPLLQHEYLSLRRVYSAVFVPEISLAYFQEILNSS